MPWKAEYGKRYRLKYPERVRECNRRYIANNPEKIRKKNDRYAFKMRAQRAMLRMKCIRGYGRNCKHCGYDDIRALQFDHVNGGGSKEQRGNKKYRAMIYKWMIANNFPPKYQLLCANCNAIKVYTHEERKRR